MYISWYARKCTYKIYVFMHACLYISVYVYMCIYYMYVCMSSCMYVSMHVQMYTYMCSCIYACTQSFTNTTTLPPCSLYSTTPSMTPSITQLLTYSPLTHSLSQSNVLWELTRGNTCTYF